MLPTQSPPETEITALDQYWLWQKEQPGYSILGAHIGRLVLTNRRLVFLSRGGNGTLHLLLFRSPPRTDHLDLDTAVHNRGSLSLWLDHIDHSALARRRDFAWFLLVRTKTRAYTFMSKLGFDKARLAEFQAALEELRASR